MAPHPDPYDLLKSIIHLSTSSLSTEAKLDRMLQSISDALGSDRCLLLKPGRIAENGFLSRLASEKRPLWIGEGSSFGKGEVLPEEEDLLCPTFACVPLYDEATLLGILYIAFLENRKFSPQETDLILLIAKEMEAAIRNAMAYYETSEIAREHEKKVKQFSTLWELNKALLTTVNFERIVQMTLTAITIGDGLGFNRAMLFMVNEKRRILEGMMAVGPDSAEDAGRIWSALSQRRENLSDLITQLQTTPESDSVLNSIVRGLQISLEHEQCILCRTVLEGRPFNIRLPHSDEAWLQNRCERGCSLGSEVGCYVGQHLGRDPRVYSFATVPLWGKGKVIGVILVDNLYNQNPITEEDLHFLSMFTNQAGLAIENAILYRNLEEVHRELREAQALLVHQEKMVALGELSTNIAHEIKNPLVAIGGFARRLNRTITDESHEKKYTETIIKEVARLERILDDIETYTHDDSLTFEEWDLRHIVEECLAMLSEEVHAGGIQLVKEFAEELPKVKGDYHQLKHAFSNVISNAYQAMNGKGRLSIRIHPVSKDGSSFVRVEVEDTGKGIDPENLHNIFNPFYSTKDARLGLGLPIVHKIIISHRGQIEVDNHPGEGVNFIISLPAN